MFHIKQIEFLNYIISAEDISINSSRIESIKQWSELTYICNIQMFIKFVNFYHQFINCFSYIVSLLNDMLKTNNKVMILLTEFKSILLFLTKFIIKTFHSLINTFIETSIFRHFNSNLYIQIKINTLDFAIKAVISQLFDNNL